MNKDNKSLIYELTNIELSNKIRNYSELEFNSLRNDVPKVITKINRKLREIRDSINYIKIEELLNSIEKYKEELIKISILININDVNRELDSIILLLANCRIIEGEIAKRVVLNNMSENKLELNYIIKIIMKIKEIKEMENYFPNFDGYTNVVLEFIKNKDDIELVRADSIRVFDLLDKLVNNEVVFKEINGVQSKEGSTEVYKEDINNLNILFEKVNIFIKHINSIFNSKNTKDINIISQEIEYTRSFLSYVKNVNFTKNYDNKVEEIKQPLLETKSEPEEGIIKPNKFRIIKTKKFKIERLKDNIYFRRSVNKFRQKYGLYTNDINGISSKIFERFNDIEALRDKQIDYYIYRDIRYNNYKHRFNYLVNYFDETYINIKDCINCFLGINNVIDHHLNIAFLYYLFFDELICIEDFLNIAKDDIIYQGKIAMNGIFKNEDVESLYITMLETKKEIYYVTIKKFKVLMTTQDQNINLIIKFRKIIGVKDNNRVKNIHNNFSIYNKYLYLYDTYEKPKDDFLEDLIEILAEYSILNYRNQLDYLMLLYYLIYDEELDMNKVDGEIDFLNIEAYKGEDLISDKRFNIDACYIKLPIFTDTKYLEDGIPDMNAAAINVYELGTGGERMENKIQFYKNKGIFYTYQEHLDSGCNGDQAKKNTLRDYEELLPQIQLDEGKLKYIIDNYKSKNLNKTEKLIWKKYDELKEINNNENEIYEIILKEYWDDIEPLKTKTVEQIRLVIEKRKGKVE